MCNLHRDYSECPPPGFPSKILLRLSAVTTLLGHKPQFSSSTLPKIDEKCYLSSRRRFSLWISTRNSIHFYNTLSFKLITFCSMRRCHCLAFSNFCVYEPLALFPNHPFDSMRLFSSLCGLLMFAGDALSF